MIVQYNYQPAQVSDNQPVTLNSVDVWRGSAPYNHNRVQVQYCTVQVSAAHTQFLYLISQLVAHICIAKLTAFIS